LITVLMVGVATPSAVATTTYRYWSYWIVDAGTSPEWGYASEGAGTRVPADGSVEGWRFGLAGQVSDIKPSIDPDFGSICAGTERQDDTKRVGIVIDPGTLDESPDGEQPGALVATCVVVDESATGLAIAQAVADVRVESGFVCGIDGYPASECAPLVEVPAASRTDDAPPTQSEGIDNVDQIDAASGANESPDAAPTQETSPTTPLAAALTVSVIAVVGFALWRRSRQAATR
jgi:hypothetical protein